MIVPGISQTLRCYQGNEVKPSERAVHRHQNERVHSNVHQAVIQYVQFTFAPKYERVHELSFNERVHILGVN